MHEKAMYDRLQAWLKTSANDDDIDRELAQLPVHMMDATTAHAHAEYLYEITKAQAEQVVAIAADELRTPRDNGKPPSEAAIEKLVLLDDNVNDARRAALEAKLTVALWRGMVETIRTRTAVIKERAQLMIAGILTPEAIYGRNRQNMNEQRRRRNG